MRRPRAPRAGPTAPASPSASGGACSSTSTVTSGIDGRARDRRGSRPRPRPARRGVTARTSTSSEQRSATTLGRVPPSMTPTLTVTPGQRPLSACSVGHDPGRLEDRAAALLGLDAGVRRAPVDRDLEARGCPCATRRCRRWPGRTRGPGTRRRRPRGGGCAGVDAGEPISSSGLATNTRRASGSPPSASRMAAMRVQPGQQAALHVGDAGAGRDAVGDRRTGRSAAVPGSNTVSMWPMHSSVGPVGVVARRCSADDRVARARGRWARRVTVAPRAAQPVGRPAADLVDARPSCSCRSRC